MLQVFRTLVTWLFFFQLFLDTAQAMFSRCRQLKKTITLADFCCLKTYNLILVVNNNRHIVFSRHFPACFSKEAFIKI